MRKFRGELVRLITLFDEHLPIPTRLYENVDHVTVLSHRAPEIPALTRFSPPCVDSAVMGRRIAQSRVGRSYTARMAGSSISKETASFDTTFSSSSSFDLLNASWYWSQKAERSPRRAALSNTVMALAAGAHSTIARSVLNFCTFVMVGAVSVWALNPSSLSLASHTFCTTIELSNPAFCAIRLPRR